MASSRRFPILGLTLLLPFALTAVLPAQPASLRVRQLSPEGSAFTDNLGLFFTRVSADGKWVLTWVDANTDDIPDLYAVPRFGGAARRLSALRPAGSNPVLGANLFLTPDGRRVVFGLDQETLGRDEVWSVPIEGPAGAAVKLSPAAPLAAELLGILKLSEDGQFASFLFGVPGEPHQVWSAPSDGSGPAFELHGAYPAGATGVQTFGNSGHRVVFLADLAVAGRMELWSAPFDGTTSAVRLNGSLIAAGDVLTFQISPDGQRVFYTADQRVDEQVELYSVPIAGPFSAAERLNPDLPSAGDVTFYRTDGSPPHVLFLADSSADETFELWSAPEAGPTGSAVKLNGSLVAGGDVLASFAVAGDRLVYIADAAVNDAFELYLVPIAGPSQAGFRVNANLPAGGDVTGAAILASGEGPVVIALGDLRIDGKSELFVAPIDGSSAPVPVFADPPVGQGLVATCGVGFSAAPPATILCADATVAGRTHLYSAPFDLASQPELLSGPDQAGSDVTEIKVSPTGPWVAFRHDPEVDDQFNLYRARADGIGAAERIHAVPFAAGGDIAEPLSFDFTPDGRGIVYLADHDADEKLELWISDGMVFRGDFEEGNSSQWSSVVP
jgi:hypothetical protein